MSSFKYIRGSLSNLDYPKWGEIGHGHFWGGKDDSYLCYEEDILVAYAGINTNLLEGENLIKIDCLETNPDYRRQGHARKLFNMIVNDYPNVNFFLNPTSEHATLNFWTNMGFVLLFQDMGTEEYGMICINSETTIQDQLLWMSDSYSICEVEVCEFTYAGAIWDQNQKRFVLDLTYEEELIAVKNNPFHIKYVKEQTKELQMIVAISECSECLSLVDNIYPEVKIVAINNDWCTSGYLGDVTDEEIALVDKKERESKIKLEQEKLELKQKKIKKSLLRIKEARRIYKKSREIKGNHDRIETGKARLDLFDHKLIGDPLTFSPGISKVATCPQSNDCAVAVLSRPVAK